MCQHFVEHDNNVVFDEQSSVLNVRVTLDVLTKADNVN